MNLASAESAKYCVVQKDLAPSALETFDEFHPGPLAQAITSRAVGAETRSFHAQLDSLD
jgi:hypothetical protein